MMQDCCWLFVLSFLSFGHAILSSNTSLLEQWPCIVCVYWTILAQSYWATQFSDCVFSPFCTACDILSLKLPWEALPQVMSTFIPITCSVPHFKSNVGIQYKTVILTDHYSSCQPEPIRAKSVQSKSHVSICTTQMSPQGQRSRIIQNMLVNIGNDESP